MMFFWYGLFLMSLLVSVMCCSASWACPACQMLFRAVQALHDLLQIWPFLLFVGVPWVRLNSCIQYARAYSRALFRSCSFSEGHSCVCQAVMHASCLPGSPPSLPGSCVVMLLQWCLHVSLLGHCKLNGVSN